MVDAIRLAEAIVLSVIEEPGLTMSLPAFLACCLLTAAITWRAQRIG